MQYRPEIDGLRGLAVLPVILFHANFETFSGGFVGVDIFFVISGYLITTILIDDLENNRFSLLYFYERRARRILPVLFLVMGVCTPAAWFLMLPTQFSDFSASLMAVSLFFSNILFWRQSGYFDSSAENNPLLHTWSLAVEEQFYLVFPIFLLLMWRFRKEKTFWVIISLAAISFLLSEWGWRNKSNANFYLTPTRAWELLVGSISAFAVQKRGVQANNMLAAIGVLGIAISIFCYDETTPFPSIYTAVPVLGTSLIVLFAGTQSVVARILSMRFCVFFGLISYSLYLWHQPLFAFLSLSGQEPSLLKYFLLIVMSIGLSIISYKYVEQPFRNREHWFNRNHVFWSALTCTLAFSSIGLFGYLTDGYKDTTEARGDLYELAIRVEANRGISRDCEGNIKTPENCSSKKDPKILLWGDSFAMHLYQGIHASNPEAGVQQHTLSSCSPILGISRMNASNNMGYSWAKECQGYNLWVYEWLKMNKSVELVILSSPFGWVTKEKYILFGDEVVLNDSNLVTEQFNKTVAKIRDLGVGVVLVSPTPTSGSDIGNCLLKKYQFNLNKNCDFMFSEDSFSYEFVKAVEPHVSVYWLHKDICDRNICRAEVNDRFIYRDDGHLSKEGSEFLGMSNNWSDVMYDLVSKFEGKKNFANVPQIP